MSADETARELDLLRRQVAEQEEELHNLANRLERLEAMQAGRVERCPIRAAEGVAR